MDSEKNSAVGASQNAQKKKCEINIPKIVSIISAIVIVVVLIISVVILFFNKQNDASSSYEEYANQLIADAIARSHYGESNADFAVGLKTFTEAKAETSDEEKLAYIYVAEARYASQNFARMLYARELLNNELVKNNTELQSTCFYKRIDYYVADLEQDTERMALMKEGGCLNEE